VEESVQMTELMEFW